jgi:hypothetical protein
MPGKGEAHLSNHIDKKHTVLRGNLQGGNGMITSQLEVEEFKSSARLDITNDARGDRLAVHEGENFIIDLYGRDGLVKSVPLGEDTAMMVSFAKHAGGMNNAEAHARFGTSRLHIMIITLFRAPPNDL